MSQSCTLGAPHRKALKAMLAATEDRAVASLVGVSRRTALRAALGLELRAATVKQIEAKLAAFVEGQG